MHPLCCFYGILDVVVGDADLRVGFPGEGIRCDVRMPNGSSAFEIMPVGWRISGD